MEPETQHGFPWMFRLLPEQELGGARVHHTRLDGEAAHRASYVNGQHISTEPGTYTSLFVTTAPGQIECMMSDLRYERATCAEVVERAHGDVLVAGLGLGMILHPILRKPDVRSVTVVEKYPDVVRLISPTLPTTDGLTIVVADIFEWSPPLGVHYDVIWFDIWPDISADRLPEMRALHQRFAPFLKVENPGRWMESWHRVETERILSARSSGPEI
jgi:spermidine synthase